MPIISATQEVELWRLFVSLGKKVSKTPSQLITQAWQHVPVIPAMWEAKIGGLKSRLAWVSI
jgi:hypothetical protein